MRHSKVLFCFVTLALMGALVAAGCDGTAGKDGVAGLDGVDGKDGVDGTDGTGKDGVNGKDGVDGKDGTAGKDGVDGKDAVVAYAGSAACGTAGCHDSIVASFKKTGHPFKLTKVSGAKPIRPFDTVTGGVPDPPLSLKWSDISYVIGGFAWKARYVDKTGLIVTGTATDKTQWSFANTDVGSAGTWAAYHAGEKKPYTCGGCHTTGWIPCAVGKTSCKHQDGMPNMAGSFQEGGIQCEACHGPSKAHTASPYLVKPKVDRSPEACGKCHRRDDVENVNAKGGFIRHHEQYEELFSSKKHAMRCIDCHDPHKSVKFKDATVNPKGGIRIPCKTCHVGFDKNQKNTKHGSVNCIDCHMPRLVKSAAGDAAKFTGDIRTHMFIINTSAAAKQFSTDGKNAMPYVALDWACKSCHRTGGAASVKTDTVLENMATGYHN